MNTNSFNTFFDAFVKYLQKTKVDITQDKDASHLLALAIKHKQELGL